jgi:hypothetical protein
LDLLLFGNVPYNVPHLGFECNIFMPCTFEHRAKDAGPDLFDAFGRTPEEAHRLDIASVVVYCYCTKGERCLGSERQHCGKAIEVHQRVGHSPGDQVVFLGVFLI